MLDELRTVARGWRWGRPGYKPSFERGPRIRTESSFETDWARRDGWNLARAIVQESLVLPAVRMVARPTVRGRDRLERLPQPAIVAANHASHLDTALLIEAVPLGWRHKLAVGAAADYFFKDKLRGNAAALAMGAFPIDRDRAGAASAKLALRLVREGWNLILFPEGGRSDDGWLQELSPGAAMIATMTGRPIVPVWITGTEHIWRKGSNRIRPGRTQILIGDALFPEAGERRRELNARFEQAMRRLAVEATKDWWTSLRPGASDVYGPDVARWRRIWERGDAPAKPKSDWD
jgi:1-acyl-sn-glycerol-3-phosphate acyltransferase